jgi:hypothetical protein
MGSTTPTTTKPILATTPNPLCSNNSINGTTRDKFSFIHIQKTKRKTLSTTKPSTKKHTKNYPNINTRKSQIIRKNKSRRIAQ